MVSSKRWHIRPRLIKEPYYLLYVSFLDNSAHALALASKYIVKGTIFFSRFNLSFASLTPFNAAIKKYFNDRRIEASSFWHWL